MNNRRIAICTAMVFAVTRGAFGQTAPAPTEWRIGIERVTGVGYTSVSSAGASTSGAYVHLLGTDGLSAYGAFAGGNLMLGAPRIAVDYAFAAHFTVGLSLGVAYSSAGFSAMSTSLPSGSIFGFGVAPRVGYEFQLGPQWAFWPHLGVTYGRASASSSGSSFSTAIDQFWLNVEPTLAFIPTRHVAFLAILVADIPLLGSITQSGSGASSSSVSVSAVLVGLELGLQARF